MEEKRRLVRLLIKEIRALREQLAQLRAGERLNLRRAERGGFERDRARRESA